MRGVKMAAAVVLMGVVSRAGFGATKVDTWTNGSGDGVWNTTSLNWSSGGAGAAYADGDTALFYDVPGGNGNVTLGQALTPGVSMIVATDGTDYVFGGSGNLVGGANVQLVKSGLGTMTLRNSTANTRTGQIELCEGAFVEDFSGLGNATNLVSPNATVLMSGGTWTLRGSSVFAGVSSQTVPLIDFRKGYSTVSVMNGAGTGTVLNMGTIDREVGGTVNFMIGANGTLTTTTPSGSGGILGFATVGGRDWAVSAAGAGAGTISALTTYTDDVWAPGNNTNVTTSAALASGGTTNSLRFDGNAGDVTVTLGASGPNTVTSGGILMTANVGAHNVTIARNASGGFLMSGNTKDLMVIQNDALGVMTMGAPMADAISRLGFTKSGVGTVVVTTTASTYTGVTTINGGTLQVQTIAPIGMASSLGAAQAGNGELAIVGGTLRVMQASTTDRAFEIGSPGGTLDAEAAVQFTSTNPVVVMQDTPTTLTLTGSDTVGNTLAMNLVDPDQAHNAKLSLVKDGPGTWSLTGIAASYTGLTRVLAGTLQVHGLAGSVSLEGGTLIINGGTVSGSVTSHGGALVMQGKLSGSLIVQEGTTTETGFLGSPVVLNGGLLAGNGTLGATTAGSGAHTINPGSVGGIGTMTVQSLTGNGFTTLAFDLGSPDAGATASSADLLNAGTGAVTLTGSTFAFSQGAITASKLGYYRIIQANAGNVQMAGVNLPTPAGGFLYTLDSVHDAGFVDVHLGLLGDANDDGHVDLNDLSIVLNNFGAATGSWGSGNFDGAGTVDLTDLSVVLNGFGMAAPGAAVVGGEGVEAAPEGGTAAVLGIVAVGVLRRRRGKFLRSGAR